MKYHLKLKADASKTDQQDVSLAVKKLGATGMTRVFPSEKSEPLKSIYTIEIDDKATKRVEKALTQLPSVEYVEPHTRRSVR